MRVLALVNPLCGLGHAAVVGGVLAGVRELQPDSTLLCVGGGVPVPAHLLPEGADGIQLPALRPTVGLFSQPGPVLANIDADEVRAIRRKLLVTLLRRYRPDAILVEHFPFGRFAFSREIVAVLDEARATIPGCRIVSSFAVLGGRKRKDEDRVVAWAQAHFDELWVHTDERLEPLGKEYPSAAPKLAPMVHHTGYVLSVPAQRATEDPEALRARLGFEPGGDLVVAHAGGGQDGAHAIAIALDAFRLLHERRPDRPAQLLAVTGPRIPETDYTSLRQRAALIPHVHLQRSRPDLHDCVAAADAVVCMAGYASGVELLAARRPALLVPRRSDNEQVRRAHRLEEVGAGRVLPAAAGATVAAEMLEELLSSAQGSRDHGIDLGGALRSAERLRDLCRPGRTQHALGGAR